MCGAVHRVGAGYQSHESWEAWRAKLAAASSTGPRAPRSPEKLRELFLKRVREDAATGCWLWLGGSKLDRTGLRTSGFAGYSSAYRYAYEEFVGPIPAGSVIDHVCEDPMCVNPEHLEAVSNGENIRRAHAARR